MRMNPKLSRDERIRKMIASLDELYNYVTQDVRSKFIPDLQAMRNELVANLATSRWQPIVSAPEMQNVIVYAQSTTGDWFVGEAFHKIICGEDEGWWWANTDSEYADVINPSMWQPLPEKPDAKLRTTLRTFLLTERSMISTRFWRRQRRARS